MNLQPDSLAESVSKTSARKPGSSMSQAAIIGILTVSDRASRGDYEDRGGPAIQAYLTELMSSPWVPVSRIVSDDRHLIAAELRKLADETQCCLIVTTGGTGPAVRDVTPEATGDVCEKMLPGFGELMRKVSLEKVPTAILSRQTAGIRGKALIINLPGQPRAIRECLSAVMPAVPWCIELIGGPRLETVPEVCRSYRPPGA
jgi:molybdopterin adenylyltransferase